MTSFTLSGHQVAEMLANVCQCIIEAEPALSEADRNLGDGDHGLGMKRGMTAALESLKALEEPTVSKALMEVGTAMMTNMGGASGAIFGTFFRSGAKAIKGVSELDSESFSTFLIEGNVGIKARGGAKVGDKTIVDALEPAALAAEACKGETLLEAMSAAAQAAEQGLEDSKAMIAQFGRAKSLGQGAIGFPDAGAMSMTLILKSMLDYSKNLA